MAKRLSREGLQPLTREFDSHRPLQSFKPHLRLQSAGRAVITTAEAIATRNPIMRFSAVDLKEIHSDLPFVPDRMPQIR